MNDEDKAWAKNWMRHANGDWGKQGRVEDQSEDEQLCLQLQRMRHTKSAAYDWLITHNAYAKALAERTGMEVSGLAEQHNRNSWQDITAVDVRAKVQAIQALALFSASGGQAWGRCLAAALAKFAPHRLGFLPPAWIKEHAEQPDNVVPMRTAAAPMRSETKRGPVVDDDEHSD